MAETKELQVREKQKVSFPLEHTKPGLMFKPAVDIYETDLAVTVIADMPGVSSDNIEIDIRDGILTLTGEVRPWEGADESDVLIEFEIGKYFRQFTLSDAIDQDKIEANLANGVLWLTLPKTEKALPRKITVKNG